MAEKLFDKKLKVINMGLPSFAKSLKELNTDVVHVEFKPPAGGDVALAKIISMLDSPLVDAANKKAFELITGAQPVLTGIRRAKDVVPGMKKNLILHAGPPIEWERMCGPVRGAVTGALIYEGLASSEKEAEELASSGKIEFSPCHHHRAVGPMAGVLSYSMYVFEVKNTTGGNSAYCTLNEGLGKVLRFGANSPDVIPVDLIEGKA